MAVAAWLASLATGPVTFALALSVLWIADGTCAGIAQATRVDRFTHDRGCTLARWTLWSLAGDLIAPALLATLALAGLGWRAAFVIVGVILALWFIALVVAGE